MLTLNLRTRDPARARYLAGQITALADTFVEEARSMGLTPQQTHQIFAQAFTEHLDRLERIAIRERAERGYEPEQERSTDQQMGWVYRLFETRGHGAQLDERAVSQMWAAGLDEASIVEVAAMLDDMRRKRFVPERRERLQAVVEAQGGEPSPMALRTAEHQIYRARAAACFQVARRHDGVRVEDDALLAQILETRLKQSVNQPDPRAKVPPHVPSPARTSTMAQQQSHAASDAEHLQASNPSGPAIVPDVASHFLVLLGETLIAKKSRGKNEAKAWDGKTSKQARQTFRLFAKLLGEQGVFKVEQLKQSHFAELTNLLDNVAKSYGKSQHDWPAPFEVVLPEVWHFATRRIDRCRRRDTSRKRSSRSYAKLVCWSHKASRLLRPSARSL